MIAADKSVIWSSLTDNQSRARLLAISAPHSGDWLHALPVAACGTRLDDEAVLVVVGLSLGVHLCEPHPCPCGAPVDARGMHSSAGRSTPHYQLNDLIWRALVRASVPSVKEPNGLFRSEGNRPDGLTLIPWQTRRCLAGTLLWSTHSPHLTSKLQARLLAVWQKALPSARKPNIQPSLGHTFRATCC